MDIFRTQAGYFEGTYSFTDEESGETEPTGWTNADEGSAVTSVVDEFGGLKKCLRSRFYGTNDDAVVYHTFSSAKTSGIVEYWVISATTDIEESIYHDILRSDDTLVCGTKRNDSALADRASHVLKTGLQLNQKTHVAMCFNASGTATNLGDGGGDLSNGKARFYINGVNTASYNLNNTVTADKFRIRTSHGVA